MSSLPRNIKPEPAPERLIIGDSESKIYYDGLYLKHNPSWHVEESPFKVRQIVKMMKEQRLAPKSVCDVGCGVGAVLAELQPTLPARCVCCGYDLSPYAISVASRSSSRNLHFEVRDVRREKPRELFDLVLLLDVFEHVEDYIGLLRDIRSAGKQKLFHIPLDLSVQAVIRRNGLLRRRDNHAHLHYFTKETALRTLTDIGYKLVHYFYTPRCIELGDELVQKLVRLPRRIAFSIAPDITVRVLGGYSLMVLAE